MEITDSDIVAFSRECARPALIQWLQSGKTASDLIDVAQTAIPGDGESVINKINAAITEHGADAMVNDGGKLMSLRVLRTAYLVAVVVYDFMNRADHPMFNPVKPIDLIRLTARESGETRSRI
jgi:hypothetical protein